VPALTAGELKAELDAGRPVFILDVREPHEFAVARIPGSTLIPLAELPRRLEEVDKEADIVCHCKMGGRSAKATAFLNQQGYRARNLTGGITAWSDEVDPTVPKY